MQKKRFTPLRAMLGTGLVIAAAAFADPISVRASVSEAAEDSAEKDEEEIAVRIIYKGEEVFAEEGEEAEEEIAEDEISVEVNDEAEAGAKAEQEALMKPKGQQVADYAVQFVGNPYRYGGTSLTNGADCSGFILSVYANFGVGLPHSSSQLARVGKDVGNNLANAVPGDIICYSGHAGIYIGGGRIVHASTERTGIKISSAAYRPIKTIRRVI